MTWRWRWWRRRRLREGATKHPEGSKADQPRQPEITPDAPRVGYQGGELGSAVSCSW